MTVTDASPLIKTRRLACSADHAFDVFVERIGGVVADRCTTRSSAPTAAAS